MPFNFPIIVGSATPTPVEDWTRPGDWLPIPTIQPGEEVVYILMQIYNTTSNFAAIRFASDYTVDWGDGNAENVSSGVKAEHQYDWDDLSSYTSEGFKQTLIKITPQTGCNLTLVDLQEYHSLLTSQKYSQFLDLVFNIPNVSGANLVTGGTTIYHALVRRYFVSEVGALTSLFSICNGFFSLEYFPLFDTSSVTSAASAFKQCYNLKSIGNFNLSSCETLNQAFASSGIETLDIITSPLLTNLYYAFRETKLTSQPNINLTNVNDFGSTFAYNYFTKTFHLQNSSHISSLSGAFTGSFNTYSIIVDDASFITVTTNAFRDCPVLSYLILTGIRFGFSIANCQFSATSLNDLFTSIGTASGAQSIVITGNYGAATCDQTIATAKGWTIVN